MSDIYTNLSIFYDEIMWEQIDYVTFIQKVIKNYVPNTKKILDLACWTGEILSKLDEKFYKVWIDNSQWMLEIARNKVKNCKFILSDIRNISLKDKFDLIMCNFDSINHLDKISDLGKVFNNAYNLLNKWWVFVFDTNSIYKFERMKKLKPIIFNINKNYIIFQIENNWYGSVIWDIKIFKNIYDNNFELSSWKIKEISFKVSKIRKKLNKFTSVITRSLKWEKINRFTERIFFICIK